MSGGRGMMKFQCSFLALVIKSSALPSKIDSLGFEVACFCLQCGDSGGLSLAGLPPLSLFLGAVGSGAASAPAFLTHAVPG